MNLKELSKVYKTELAKISALIKLGENICITSLPGGGKTMLTNMILDKEIQTEIFKDSNASKYKILSLNAYKEDYEKEKILIDAIQNPNKNFITKDLLNYEFTFLIIEDFNSKANYTKQIGKLRDIFGRKISFIITTLPSTNIEIQNIKNFYFLFNNIINIPYLNNDGMDTYIEYISHYFNIKFSKEEIEIIKDFGGGCPKIIKAIARVISNGQNLISALESQEIQILIEFLWNEIPTIDKEGLKKIALSKKIEKSLRKEVDHLSVNNLISKGKLPTWIKKAINQESILRSENKELFITNVNISKSFSKVEQNILEKLIEKKFLSRDEIIKICSKDLTNWSIDKRISRIRKKLNNYGFKKEIIKTVKGEGYKLSL